MSLRPRTSRMLVLLGAVAVAGAGVGQGVGRALIAPLQAGADCTMAPTLWIEPVRSPIARLPSARTRATRSPLGQ